MALSFHDLFYYHDSLFFPFHDIHQVVFFSYRPLFLVVYIYFSL